MATNEINVSGLIKVGNEEVAMPNRPELEGLKEEKERVELEKLEKERQEEQEQILSEKDVEEVTKFLNDSTKLFNLSLRFSVHEDTHRIVVSVLNADTDEVIRQIPTEEVLALAERLNEMVGVLFNETA
jgi:flagellar protein FlaG